MNIFKISPLICVSNSVMMSANPFESIYQYSKYIVHLNYINIAMLLPLIPTLFIISSMPPSPTAAARSASSCKRDSRAAGAMQS